MRNDWKLFFAQVRWHMNHDARSIRHAISMSASELAGHWDHSTIKLLSKSAYQVLVLDSPMVKGEYLLGAHSVFPS